MRRALPHNKPGAEVCHAWPLQEGASLDGRTSSVEQAAVLCTAVFDGDLPLLRRLIAAGVAVNSGDYGEGWLGKGIAA